MSSSASGMSACAISAGSALTIHVFSPVFLRDPWLTKRLKLICLSTWTLVAQILTECYRGEQLLPSALQNPRDETTHIIAPSSTVAAMLAAPLIECVLDVLASAENLRKVVVEVRSPPQADFRCIVFPRTFLHAALARLACGAFAGATTTLALRVDYELLAMLLDELAPVQMRSLTDLAVVAEPRKKERVEPIGPMKGQALFENLGRVPLESLRVFTKEKAVIASHISSILDHNGECPSPVSICSCILNVPGSNPARRAQARHRHDIRQSQYDQIAPRELPISQSPHTQIRARVSP